MSFYERPTRRWPAALASSCICVAIAAPSSYYIGQSFAPSLETQVKRISDDASAISNRLSVIEVEYPQAVKDGKVVGQVEYDGAKQRAQQAIDEVKKLDDTLGVVYPNRYQQALLLTQKLAQQIDNRATSAAVVKQIDEIGKVLDLGGLDIYSQLKGDLPTAQ